MAKKRKPTHPGEILNEDYIKPLNLNLQKLADRLRMARNTLFKIRACKARVTPAIALALAEAFDTTPQLWLNLQANYDLWVEDKEHARNRSKSISQDGLSAMESDPLFAQFLQSLLIDAMKHPEKHKDLETVWDEEWADLLEGVSDDEE